LEEAVEEQSAAARAAAVEAEGELVEVVVEVLVGDAATGKGTPLARRNAFQMIERAGERARLGRVTPRVLRRTLATMLANVGGDPADAAEQLGHSVEVYERAYLKPRRDKQARERMRNKLTGSGYGLLPETADLTRT
jgi:integrase